MPNNQNNPPKYVSALEEGQIKRAVQLWLNSCPDKPKDKLSYNYHGENSGLFLVPMNAPYIVRGPYILGGYEAQYQFSVDYLLQAANDDERMAADEALERVAEWAKENLDLLVAEDSSIRVKRIQRDTPAIPIDMLQSGSEVHSINLSIFYEVNV